LCGGNSVSNKLWLVWHGRNPRNKHTHSTVLVHLHVGLKSERPRSFATQRLTTKSPASLTCLRVRWPACLRIGVHRWRRSRPRGLILFERYGLKSHRDAAVDRAVLCSVSRKPCLP